MAKDKPRYSRCSDIFDLATFMESKSNGVTLREIQEEYEVSRRTAIRMLDSLKNIMSQIDEIETTDREKHWGFTNTSMNAHISFTPKEIATLEQLQQISSTSEIKEELHDITTKIKALSKKSLSTAEERIELILQTEGYAVRQVPHYKINNLPLMLYSNKQNTNQNR